MAKTSEHGRIIAAAAKTALAPLGCIRRGQSRIWQDDHRYWAINVEFQPSGWQKGSYLNIFVAWLWNVTHGYDFSYRAGSFIPFETVEQFTPPIIQLAAIAATEVQKVREKFRSFSNISNHIKANDKRAAWPGFDAAIVCGLAGDTDAARQYFDTVAACATIDLQFDDRHSNSDAGLFPKLSCSFHTQHGTAGLYVVDCVTLVSEPTNSMSNGPVELGFAPAGPIDTSTLPVFSSAFQISVSSEEPPPLSEPPPPPSVVHCPPSRDPAGTRAWSGLYFVLHRT